jgi:hypothetical protein
MAKFWVASVMNGNYGGEAKKFYRDLKPKGMGVRVGMEATGYSRWFERLLAELGFELWIGDPAEIKAKRVRTEAKRFSERLGITSGQDSTDRVRAVRRSRPETAGRGETRDLHVPGLHPLLWATPQERNLHRMADHCEKANGCEAKPSRLSSRTTCRYIVSSQAALAESNFLLTLSRHFSFNLKRETAEAYELLADQMQDAFLAVAFWRWQETPPATDLFAVAYNYFLNGRIVH